MDPNADHSQKSVRLTLFQSEATPCPYLPDRIAQDVFLRFDSLDPGLYHRLMDAGFRRSSQIVYRPDCNDCRECVPIRVPVDRFAPSRSQRRVLRRNQDVTWTVDAPSSHDDKWRLYQRYLTSLHDRTQSDDRSSFERFICYSPTSTLEFAYRVDDRIVGVGIVDVTPQCLSSVYFYYDPDESRRSLGVFSSLMEIEFCRQQGLPYWYAGFYVKDCRKMNYKAQFRPHELLGPDLEWRSVEGEPISSPIDRSV